ncbi:helix-turn-helix transcriptional regulator [Paenibacillus sp. VCA1]|uniref:helix-turn-helix domain-containing protein n=1 Tax=Paenibacillus sp. VCA1 TaxID=3039148 RepID=UPI0028727E82|nr:helix-turn-helix transcriptional regulator [Paenibacillus sp. VCA1]MDR9852913.1 helix-turn-helix transcriptional regulator [Paenibacillus sp. VCA1]
MEIKITPRLGEILKERGLTQTQLSEMSGVPQGSISRFDKNTRHDDAHLFAISRALGIQIEELFRVETVE